jgi:hypothetical protein
MAVGSKKIAKNISQDNRRPVRALIIIQDIRCTVRVLIQAAIELVYVSWDTSSGELLLHSIDN